MKRKLFLKNTGLAAAGLAFLPVQATITRKPGLNVRIAIIGTGLRGQDHLDLLLRRDDVDIVAICDIESRMLAAARELISNSGKAMPQVFTGDNYTWKKLLELKDLDAVIIATPWEWHKEMIIGALEAGIRYVGTEVVLGITLEDHWEVVRAAEKYQAHVCMLENVCYRRDVMAVLQMVREGVFGELVHLQGGYQHDLREVKFNNGVQPYGGGCEFGKKGWSEAQWRTQHSLLRNGDVYPTHGIGPVAQYINVNRGNRFMNLCSFSSKSRGLHEHVVRTCGPDHPNAGLTFTLGDVVTTSISCANGETILLQHDTSLPRPYSLGFRVQGTKGLWMDVAKGIYIEDSSEPYRWDDAQPWLEKYDHPLWQRWSKDASGAGHGGMDFFVDHMFVESIKNNEALQMDVYDAAAWSVISPLSEISIAEGNKTVEFPDFTAGRWKERKVVFGLTDAY